MAKLILKDKWKPIEVKELEPAAWEVIKSDFNKSVVAGPGAGKTELLAQRAYYLLQTGCCPWPKRILAISFKRDSATNLGERVKKRCGHELASRFDSYTYDAFSKILLDRFILGIPENWRPTNYVIEEKRDEINLFLDSVYVENDENRLYDFSPRPSVSEFITKYLVGFELPIGSFDPKNLWQYAAMRWWRRSLKGSRNKSRLSFAMIERLAALILNANPMLRKAIQMTYSHVFLDEFQDTTGPQYSFVKTAFKNSKTVITAVGDYKQQIMTWAGALPDVFDLFNSDFDAKRHDLISNYRSVPELVSILHVLARRIDPKYIETTSMSPSAFSGDHCIIYEYETREGEALHIAELISDLINNHNISPKDIALIVRQKPDDFVPQLTPYFIRYRLKLRNERELQDLIAERFTRIVPPFLRLALSGNSGHLWSECRDILMHLRGIDWEDSSNQIIDELDRFLGLIKKESYVWPPARENIQKIIELTLGLFGVGNVKLYYPEYEHGDYLQKIINSLVCHLEKFCDSSSDWGSSLDEFEGFNSIPLLTIHKSKGLEYDTVIFLGLDDNSWWNFSNQPDESTREFFVAFSRAKQRVFFTYCENRGAHEKIASLYDLLRTSGVQSVKVLGSDFYSK